MKPPPFEYHDPSSIEEALRLLADLPGAKVLAGGQSLMPMLNFRFVQPEHLVDLRRIEDLRRVEETGDEVAIGAMVCQRDLEESALIAGMFPVMRAALDHVGHMQTRNRGTIGGSLCHLDPAAELPVVTLALDGQVEVAQASGDIRRMAMADFPAFYMTPAIEPDEILTRIVLPRPPQRRGSAFQEFARRHGDFAIVSVAAVLDTDSAGRIEKARIAVGGAGAVPQRALALEDSLLGSRTDEAETWALDAHLDGIDYIGDAYYSADYRRHLTLTLCRRALTGAVRDLESRA